VATRADADIYFSAVGSGNDLWYRRLNLDVWGPWEPLAGIISGAPSATAPAGDDLHLFARGAGSDIWQRHWNGAVFESWAPLGGFAGGGIP
jgi:hypothetical protein